MNLLEPKTKKRIWTLVILGIILSFICLGLFIWGIVELSLNNGRGTGIVSTIKSTKLLGGLLVGIDIFMCIFITINITSLFINYPEYKNDVKKLFKRKEKVETIVIEEEVKE